MLNVQTIILIGVLLYSFYNSILIFHKTTNAKDLYLFILLPCINLFLLIHICTNTAISYNGLNYNTWPHKAEFFISNISLILAMLIIIFFVAKIVLVRITKIQRNSYFIFWGIMGIVCILLFIKETRSLEVYYGDYFFYSIKTIEYILYIMVFVFINIYLILGEDTGLLLYLNGFAIIILYELIDLYVSMISGYAYLGQNIFLLKLVLMIGVFIHGYGISIFSQHRFYDPILWLKSGTRMRSILIFWCYIVMLSTFSVVIVILYYFSTNALRRLSLYPFLMVMTSLILINLLRVLGNYLEKPFVELKENILDVLKKNKSTLHDIKIDEFIFLEKFIKKIFAEQKNQEHLNLEYKIKQQELETIAVEQDKFRRSIGQLVHDMNSPLETINGTLRLLSTQIPEESRRVITNSTKRLSGLAYGVLNKYNNVESENKKITPLLIALSVNELFNEKVVEYNDLNINFVLDVDDKSYLSCVMIDHESFKRMLSNLINNAVDVVKDEASPIVNVKLKKLGENVILFIEDNGYGMPKHIIDKFLQGESITEKKASGHGIGLTQVSGAIKSGNGEINIYAKDGIGTEIMIRFPLCEMPWWLDEEINLLPDSIIVIVDDEQTIHDIWDEKLKNILISNAEISIHHFMDGLQAIDYINSLSKSEKLRVYLLTDYNLEGQSTTGLDIINQVSVINVVIVSSYNNLEYELNDYINKIKFLPKKFLYKDVIKITVGVSRNYMGADMIWLDDQPDFIDIIIKENYSHLKIERYINPEELLKDVEQYKNKDIRIVLDNNYEIDNGVLYHETGVDIARKLYEIGYTNLILLTGSVDINNEKIPLNTRVILKNNVEDIHKLDSI